MTRAEIAARNARIAADIAAGMTHREIGIRYNLKKTSVAVLCHRHRIKSSTDQSAIDRRNANRASGQRKAWADPALRATRIARMKAAKSSAAEVSST